MLRFCHDYAEDCLSHFMQLCIQYHLKLHGKRDGGWDCGWVVLHVSRPSSLLPFETGKAQTTKP